MLSLPPNSHAVYRTVAVGGMEKAELLEALQRSGVEMNEYARILLASDKFQTLRDSQDD
jgi:hypothetical protein